MWKLTSVLAIGNIAAPASVEVAGWVGCLFFLAAGWNQVEKFFDRRANRGAPREIQPQPLSVSKFEKPVADSVCAGRHQEARQECQRLEQEIAQLRGQGRAEVAELHHKINKVDREVGELKACLELNNQQLMRIDTKLDRAIERQSAK
jgi:hypothetical protein